MRLLWLPGVLRAAGLTVHEVSGWRTRGADSYGPVRGITVHHTAGSRTSTDAGEIGVLLNGSNSAPPPISQLYLSRTGHWHVVASGLCYHNLIGWGGPNSGYGNDSLLGIEAQHSGGSEPWTDVQYRSYVRGVAALVRHQASGYTVTVSRVAGHKEHQPGAKSDPTFSMSQFRADVAAILAGEDDDMQLDDKITALDPVKGKAAEISVERALADTWTRTAALGNQERYLERRERAEILAEVRAVARVVGGTSVEQITAEIRAQGEQTRAALLAAVREQAPGLAAAVADRLGGEVTASEIGEALAAELAGMLAAGALGGADTAGVAS